MSVEVRPCERLCPKCQKWKHHSRFRNWTRRGRSTSTTRAFARLCKDCEQIGKNEHQNSDRPTYIIERRTAGHARTLGVSKAFLWVNMNWASLVPEMRALMTPEGRCRSCGHAFVNERDIQIEHREPPRHQHDWARQHARNLGLFCQSCNNGKRDKPYAIWLDEQEEARLTNEHHRASEGTPIPMPIQLTLEIGS